jgi:hypothetical protein
MIARLQLSNFNFGNFGNFQLWQLSILATQILVTFNFGNLQFWQLSIIATFSSKNFQFGYFQAKSLNGVQEQQHINCMDCAKIPIRWR